MLTDRHHPSPTQRHPWILLCSYVSTLGGLPVDRKRAFRNMLGCLFT